MKIFLKTLLLVAATALCSSAFADPPGRVGRISHLQGDVLFRDGSSNEATPAALNWPLTSQNVISTERGARAEVRVGSAAVRIGPDSELEITQLDDHSFKLYLAWGSANVRIRSADLAQDFELYTPQGRLLMPEPARIRIDVDAESRTGLSVYAGVARFEGGQANLPVRSGKHVEFADGDIRMSEIAVNDGLDDLDAWSAARDRRDDQSLSVRYLSDETTGYEELDANGTWQEIPDYGRVWFPRVVSADWAPYRSGRWSWIEPWGWTWVDNASWGYAPSHYGRWALHQNRWCWVPGGPAQRAVWAPALVGWVGGRNWNASFATGSAPAVGWFPLGPREAYVPAYRVSPNYVRRVNVQHVANISITNVNGVVSVPAPGRYRNRFERNALTVLPQERFVSGRTVPVASIAPPEHLPRQLRAAPVSSIAPVEIARRHPPVESLPGTGRMEHNRRIPPPQQPAAPMQVLPAMPTPAVTLPRQSQPAEWRPALAQPARPEERHGAGNRHERNERREQGEHMPPRMHINTEPQRAPVMQALPPEERRGQPGERQERHRETMPAARIQGNPEAQRPLMQAPPSEQRPMRRHERTERNEHPAAAGGAPSGVAPSSAAPSARQQLPVAVPSGAQERRIEPQAPQGPPQHNPERAGPGREIRGARIER